MRCLLITPGGVVLIFLYVVKVNRWSSNPRLCPRKRGGKESLLLLWSFLTEMNTMSSNLDPISIPSLSSLSSLSMRTSGQFPQEKELQEGSVDMLHCMWIWPVSTHSKGAVMNSGLNFNLLNLSRKKRPILCSDDWPIWSDTFIYSILWSFWLSALIHVIHVMDMGLK